MRVLLIHTNQFEFGQLPFEVERQRGLNPPISLAYIASAIRAAGHTVRILDMDAEKIHLFRLEKIIREFSPQIVGFSVMLNNFLITLKLSQFVKKIDPSIKIVYGGVQINLFPEESLKYSMVDIGVLGEGEFVFPQLLNAIESNQDLGNIPGIIYKGNNPKQIIKNNEVPPIKNLDSIQYPARDLLPIKKYTSLISQKNPVTILFTARGCPFQCTFCSKPSFWHNTRFHSPAYVANEFQSCVDLGIKEIMVYDDIFTANAKRVRNICYEIRARSIDVIWDVRTRVDLINRDILKWLKAAGCHRICFGVESGDPMMLKNYNKGITISQVKKAFDLTKSFDMEVLAYFMIGGPGETKKSIQRTYQVMKYLEPDYIHLTHVIPYPKTKLFDMALSRNATFPEVWLDLKNHSYERFPMFSDGELTRDEIFHYVSQGYRTFYYRPKYIWNKIKRIRSIHQLIQLIKGAISI
jgi:radical SAM superfamily enzyme YgiQ (UPF0313 family)